MKIKDALDRFLVQLEADGRSPHTIAQYRRHVRAVERWLRDEARDMMIDTINHETIAAFLASPAARSRPDGGVKRATSVNALRTSIRVFFGYCHRAGTVANDAARLVRRASCAPPPPRAMRPDEQARLLEELAAATTPEEHRDRVLFGLLLGAGLRLGSALALDVDDIDLDRRELNLRRTKGDRPEVVLLRQDLVDVLRGFVADRTGPVFTTARGTRLSQRQAQRRFAIWLDRAGLKGYSAHSLRHSFATGLYRRTGDIYLVQQALRHRAIASTTVYAQLDQRRLRTAIEA